MFVLFVALRLEHACISNSTLCYLCSSQISCADVASICAEAGLQAVRENRYVVLPKDFDKAYKKAVSNNDREHLFYTL